jgi:hypothetical protein
MANAKTLALAAPAAPAAPAATVDWNALVTSAGAKLASVTLPTGKGSGTVNLPTLADVAEATGIPAEAWESTGGFLFLSVPEPAGTRLFPESAIRPMAQAGLAQSVSRMDRLVSRAGLPEGAKPRVLWGCAFRAPYGKTVYVVSTAAHMRAVCGDRVSSKHPGVYPQVSVTDIVRVIGLDTPPPAPTVEP